uniref:Uncharacterized protein n=1 Tax=Anguilla anguilla TaxID=7936 RepID=A0A0E9PIX8_ANGAN
MTRCDVDSSPIFNSIKYFMPRGRVILCVTKH